jgi:hypothetical protein
MPPSLDDPRLPSADITGRGIVKLTRSGKGEDGEHLGLMPGQ